jgi:dihydropteroate synthase
MRSLVDIGLGRRTLVMGILNVTPDSFSDGGFYFSADNAVQRALEMADEGADIIDIGGESTRPATFEDNAPLDSAEEKRRILPVIRSLKKLRPELLISVDSYKPDVLEEALHLGAGLVNDVSGLLVTPSIAEIAAKANAPYILMHIPGTPCNIPENPHYEDIIQDIIVFFNRQIDIAQRRGLKRENIILDPGFGFGKNAEQNFEIVRRFAELKSCGLPLLSAPSRKRFIGDALGGLPPLERDEGTAAIIALSIAGGADIVRAHNVKCAVRAAKTADRAVR